uniref:Nuclear receptor corepressor 2 n=1 Tax=Cajanus cajan TaxID=3821 RepID=A0A151RIZ6_CAJCA|nr:Nuclear receptor corepressor 2 [Cajanus cajan]
MNKLVIWKAFVTNVLEVTETEIDSLENELKSLQSKSRDRLPCSVATSSLLVCHSAIFYFGTENTLYDTIISSNRESAKRASEAFAMLLPKECGKISNVGVCSSSLSNNDAFIKEKLAERKRFERFKEMVLTIKYKAFNHLWEKDLCLRSTRKCPSTSHSNLELDLQTISKGCKKNRSSMRHRFPFPGGKQLSLVPTSEMISYTSQLLSEISHHEVNENILKMPTLILDKRDKIFSMFTSSNGLVDDPLTIEKERSMINPWTFEERNIFLEKFVAFGKDFRKISSFLDHKTTADCVEFYYKNHKSDFFEKTKKTKASKYRKLRTTKNSLMASSKKRNRKENVDSLQILNEAPVMARRTQGNRRTRPRKPRLWKGCDNMKKLTGGDRITERSSLDVLQDERERVAADALVSLCDSRSSSKAVITRSVDPVEAIRDKPCLKMRIQCQQPVMSQPDVTQDIDHGTRYDEGCGEIDDSDWTNEEKATFLQAVSSFGKDFTMIAKHVGTKSKDQCKIFFIKGKKWPGLNLMHHKPDYNVSPVNDLNSGRNDKDDGCVVVADTIIGSDKSGTKTNGDEPSSSMNLNDDESKPAEAENLSTDINESKELEAEVDHEDGNMASNSCALNSESASEKTPRNVVLKLFGKTITIPLSSQKSDLVS